MTLQITDDIRLNCGFYGAEEGVRNHSAKIATNRKRYCCMNCRKLVKTGGRMYVEQAIVDDEWCSSRTCLDCIDGWIYQTQVPAEEGRVTR